MTNIPSLMALRCLDASARLSSFTRAAEEIHLTQGAVSHQVRSLEALLGVTLFVRRRSGLELTAAGRAYWSDVAEGLRLLERATENMIVAKGHGATLNLSVASSLASYWLIPKLSEFVRAHPEITLNLSTRVGPIDFETSKEDASIEFCDGAAPGLQATLVHPLILRPYVSPKLLPARRGRRPANQPPLRPREFIEFLNKQPLIHRTTVPAAWAGWLDQMGLTGAVAEAHLRRGPKCTLVSMALSSVMAGIGVALLPEYIVKNALEAGQLVCLSEQSWRAPKGYFLRYPFAKSEMAVLQTFSRWLASVSSAFRDDHPLARADAGCQGPRRVPNGAGPTHG
jgi:DNA-binding transcriptional LysR family regulator